MNRFDASRPSPPGKPYATPEEGLVIEILRTSQAVGRWIAESLKPSGLTPTQFNVLRILRGARPEALACGAIAERMVNHDPDLTRLLDRLEAAGLAEKRRDTGDRRVVMVNITQDGVAAVERASRVIQERLRRELAHLGTRRLETLHELMELARRAPSRDPAATNPERKLDRRPSP
jgi:DNA-binding MarR family transcriptional regulator